MSLAVILIWIVIILVGLGLLAMLLFGIRGATYGKVKPMSILMVALPIALLLALGLVMGDWALAAIYTVMAMFAIAVLALLVTGFKGLFN